MRFLEKSRDNISIKEYSLIIDSTSKYIDMNSFQLFTNLPHRPIGVFRKTGILTTFSNIHQETLISTQDGKAAIKNIRQQRDENFNVGIRCRWKDK